MTKIALITGATSGFGKACAELFAEKGWHLVLCGRRQERLQQLKEQLSAVSIHTVVCDVRNREEVAQMIAQLPRSEEG